MQIMIKLSKKGYATIITLQKRKRFMKKTKILTVLGVLLAMGITACGGKTASKSASGAAGDSSGGGASASGQSASTSSSSRAPAHQHNWVEDTTAYVAPGCETEGKKVYRCQGEGTCTQNNGVKEEAIPANGHTWGEKQDVAIGNGDTAYEKYECTVANCGAVKFEIPLKALATASGKSLSTCPGDLIKLKNNDTYFDFVFDSAIYGTGKLYLRGAMDNWSSGNSLNTGRTLFSGKIPQQTDDNANPNLKISVNGKALTVTNKKTMTEMLPAIDADHEAAGNNWSAIGEMLYGDDLMIGPGLNEIKYERVDSFNPGVSHLLLVVHPANHEHTFGDEWQVGKAYSCTEDGWSYKQCSTCGVMQKRVDKAAHKWGEPTEIAADTDKGTSLVRKYTCSACNKVKYEVPLYLPGEGESLVKNFTLSEGATEKTYQPTGSVKLGSNNQYLTFKVEFAKFVYGTAYQVGSMDQYMKADGTAGANYNQKYTSGGGSTSNGCNFKFEVGADEIDLSANKNTPVSDWLGQENRDIVKNDKGETENWSFAKPCPIGEFDAEAGVVEFKYTRLGSYNLANEAFEFVVNETEHTHQAATEWSSDGEYHWHACANCPSNKKFDLVKHTLESDPDLAATDTESDCLTHGIAHKICSICNKKVNVELPLADHDWELGTEDANGITPLECKKCHSTGIQFDGFTGDNASRLSSGKINYAGDFVWALNMPKQGKVALQMSIGYSAGNGDKKFGSGYTLKCGDTNGEITIQDVRYDSVITVAATQYQFVEFGKVDVPEGAATITFHYANANVRLLSNKLVRLIYIA